MVEVYDLETLIADNKHLLEQYEIKCNEKRDCDNEIARLTKLLMENNIDFEID